jgi:hypothetical protein
MRNLLANIVNAWVRGTLHAINGVLFAKYLTMAWGFEAMTAAALSGATAGVWLMRGKIVGACRSVWQLRCGVAEINVDMVKSVRDKTARNSPELRVKPPSTLRPTA